LPTGYGVKAYVVNWGGGMSVWCTASPMFIGAGNG